MIASEQAYRAPVTGISDDERLLVMQDVAGFMPVTGDELDEAFYYINVGANATERMDAVVGSMTVKGAKKPDNHAMALTHEYIGYSRGSTVSKAKAERVQTILGEGGNPRGRVIDVVPWPARGGLRVVLQHLDIINFAHGNETVVKNPLEASYSKKIAPEEIAEWLEAATVRDVQEALVPTIANHAARHEHWFNHLKELKVHKVAGPIVRRAAYVHPL